MHTVAAGSVSFVQAIRLLISRASKDHPVRYAALRDAAQA